MNSPIPRIYLAALFWITGRALQAGSFIDEEIQQELNSLPEDFSFALTVFPDGPQLNLKLLPQNRLGKLTVLKGQPGTMLHMKITSFTHAYRLFTFRQSLSSAAARGDLTIQGSLSQVCIMVRILERVEHYLLPRRIACRAVKRYESPPKKHRRRMLLYLRILCKSG